MMQTLDISLLWMEPIANNQISLWQTSIKIFGVFKIQYNGQYCWVLFCFLDDFRLLLSVIYFLNFHLSVYQYLILAYIANAPAPPPDIAITNDGDTNLNKSHLSNSTDCRRTLELFKKNSYLHTHTSHMCGKNYRYLWYQEIVAFSCPFICGQDELSMMQTRICEHFLGKYHGLLNWGFWCRQG